MALVALSALRILQSNEKASLEEAGFVAFGVVRCNDIRTLPTFALVYGSPLRAQMTRLRKFCLVTEKFRTVEHQSWGFRPVCSGTRKVRIVRK